MLHGDADRLQGGGGEFAPQQIGSFIVGCGGGSVLVGKDSGGNFKPCVYACCVGKVGVECVHIRRVLPVEDLVTGVSTVLPLGVQGSDGGSDGLFGGGACGVCQVDAQYIIVVECGGADGDACGCPALCSGGRQLERQANGVAENGVHYRVIAVFAGGGDDY